MILTYVIFTKIFMCMRVLWLNMDLFLCLVPIPGLCWLIQSTVHSLVSVPFFWMTWNDDWLVLHPGRMDLGQKIIWDIWFQTGSSLGMAVWEWDANDSHSLVVHWSVLYLEQTDFHSLDHNGSLASRQELLCMSSTGWSFCQILNLKSVPKISKWLSECSGFGIRQSLCFLEWENETQHLPPGNLMVWSHSYDLVPLVWTGIW